MSHSRLIFLTPVAFLMILSAACGGVEERILAEWDGMVLTESDFYEEFRNLPPEEQVDVLEPGGKLALTVRLIYGKILLDEASETDPEGLAEWLELSKELWLARRWLELELESMFEAGIDTASMDSMMAVDVSMQAVLLRDSSTAAGVRERWSRLGPSDPDVRMPPAPWSRAGSSYFEFSGSAFVLYSANPDFTRRVMEHAGEGPAMFPAFGVWAVAVVDVSISEPPEYDVHAASKYFLSAMLDELFDVTVMSEGVGELGRHLEEADGGYVLRPSEDFDPRTVVAVFPGGELTAGDVLRISSAVREENFLGGVPELFAPFRMPPPMLDPEVDLWGYAEALAETRRKAGLARDAGIQWPKVERELTKTDHVLRVNVLLPLSYPDTAAALAFYGENRGIYMLPELRSVMVAYVPAEWLPEGDIASFDDLGAFYSRTDGEGAMLPTEPNPEWVFTGYGQEVFSAEQGVFTGPVHLEDEDVRVFFEVVEIIPPSDDDPEVLLPLLRRDCRNVLVARRLEEYLLELWETRGVEIDSTAVRELDPWGAGY